MFIRKFTTFVFVTILAFGMGISVEAVDEVLDGAIDAITQSETDDLVDELAHESVGETSDDEEKEAQQLREAIEEQRALTREALESIPDPSQLATQADPEQLGQGQPVLEEQLVYSVSAWDGQEYAGSFAAKQVPTFYLMADATSIVNAQQTKVYFWPITGEYMADWFDMREEVPGTLEILQGNQVVGTYDRVDYAYYYPSGHGSEQRLFLGDEATEVYEDYQSRIDAFYDATTQYYDDYREWQRTMDQILKEVQETGIYKKPEEIPAAPVQPEPPQDFAYAPRTSFAINLPEGKYGVRMRGENGEIIAGSEKQLEVFSPRRIGVTYEVIPAHKWTRRIFSHDTSSVFYQDGQRVFYLIPSHAREFNFYQFVKMSNLHKPLEGEGMKSAWTWAPFGELESGTLQILKDGQVVETVEKRPYYVQQTPGYALGYDIIDFDPVNNPLLEMRSPTFEGYRISVPADGNYQLRLVDSNGGLISGSQRQIRPVEEPGNVIYWISLLPVGVGAIVWGGRRTARANKGRKKQ